MSLGTWKQEFENKNILIWGYGIEGKSSYAFIRKLLPEQSITIADGGKGYEVAQKETTNTNVIKDADIQFDKYDLILKAPGIVVKDESILPKITGQAQLFLKHYRNQTVGITGTKGKSTTTSLVAHILKEKYDTVLVGNIGKACFDEIEEMEKGAIAAFELSCHQMEYATYSPHVGVFLNLYEEHLDHYGSFEKYGEAKFHILKYQTEGDISIISSELPQYISQLTTKSYLIGKDIYATDHILHIPNHILEVKQCSLIGTHNYQNLAVAYMVAHLLGISDEQVQHACRTFQPLHHRLENLGEHEGITYINDSISTIGQATIQALKAVNHVETVLIGGMDRGISYKELKDYLVHDSKVNVIFMYATGQRIYDEMTQEYGSREHTYLVGDLKQAVSLAKQITAKGHACLLSPAASSYDHFKNFEERGRIFQELAFEDYK